MNDLARRIAMDRMRSGRDYARRNRDYEREDYASSDRRRRARDYEMEGDRRRMRDYEDDRYDREMDGKQGVKGTGPYGIGGRLYSRNRDYEMDGDDYEMDGAPRGVDMRLRKRDYEEWKHALMNADGTHGEHFDKHQIEKTAEQMGIKYRDYDEKDLCMTVNMLYSDFCEVIKQIRPDLPPEKEVIAYTKMAQAWLEDKDASAKGSEKLALYYYCIVSDEE